MGRKFQAREWDGQTLEADYMTYKADPLRGPYLDMVREENGTVVKSKLYLAYGILVEDVDHDKTVAEVVENEEEMIKKGQKLFDDQMNNLENENANVMEPDMNKVLQSYG